MLRIEFFKDKKKEFRFRIRAWNGRILCTSEGYKRKRSAVHAKDLIVNNIADAQFGVIEKW